MIDGSEESLAAVDLDYGLLEKIVCNANFAVGGGTAVLSGIVLELTPEEEARVRQLMERAEE